MEEILEENPVNQEKTGIRDEKGRFMPGVSGNLNGRPKGQSLKEYDRENFAKMTPEEKKEWLKDIPKEFRYKMAEGNPAQDVGVQATGEININLIKYGDHNSSPLQPTQLPAPDTGKPSEV